ncbi:MAG: hypothetical protein JO363_17655 [Solirubrobacterales bacterium]|nr:hypothetical protein [Solirubrobacterales bacterium]
MNNLSKYLVETRIDDLRRDARRARGAAVASDSRGRRRETPGAPITIRRDAVSDAAALRRIADLDSSEVPAAPLLLAAVDGEVRAAVSLSTGAVVADPFHDTAVIVELLTAYAAHERADRRTRLRGRIRRAFGGRERRAGGRGGRGAPASVASPGGGW